MARATVSAAGASGARAGPGKPHRQYLADGLEHPTDWGRRVIVALVGYCESVTILETIAVYVVIPGAIVVLAALLTVVPGRSRSRPPRYRPGQPWEYSNRLWAGNLPVVVSGSGQAEPAQSTGGARGTW